MALPTGTARYALGILALLSVVCIWVSSSFLMNNLFAGQNYNKPFFITYVNTASFSLYLLGPLFRHWCGRYRDRRAGIEKSALVSSSSSIASAAAPGEQRRRARSRSYGSMNRRGSIDSVHANNWNIPARSTAPVGIGSVNESTLEQGSHHPHQQQESEQQRQEDQIEDQPLTNREIAELSLAFCILWFLANWASNASLAYTTVASSTILTSMSGLCTLAIGALMKVERFSALKLIAVCVTVIGVALVSESDRRESDQGGNNLISIMGISSSMISPAAPSAPLFGDFLALLSAVFYGCYTVLLKVRIRNESRVNMSLFFGYVGLFNLVLLWPMFGVLHLTGIEPFELPTGSKVIWMIVVNALFGTFLSDYLWLLSMLLTSPLVVTLGLSLSIPLALLGDIFGNGRILGATYWLGAGLVLAGFFGVNGVAISEQKESEVIAVTDSTSGLEGGVGDGERERLLHQGSSGL
ncbi:hypothetical protein B0O80DRAFT_417765 [Mortierella sp. GBAus27b]|nr:hypothetical protein B0O80DRAFT_417765 [Mortierella sp. GBAus27b]